MELNFDWVESNLLLLHCNHETISQRSFLCMIQFSFFREFFSDILKQISFPSFEIQPSFERLHLSKPLVLHFSSVQSPSPHSFRNQWNSFLSLHQHTIRICKCNLSSVHIRWLYSLAEPSSYTHWNQIPANVWCDLLRIIFGPILDLMSQSDSCQFCISVRSPFEIRIDQKNRLGKISVLDQK